MRRRAFTRCERDGCGQRIESGFHCGIHRALPCRVLVIARTVEHDELVALLRAHVKGYLPFNAIPADLADAIRTVSHGELVWHETAARTRVESIDQGALLLMAPSTSHPKV